MASKPIVVTDFAELPDGTLLDSIEDPNDSSRSRLAVYDRDGVRFVDQFECENRILVPISRSTEIMKHVGFPRGVAPYQSITYLVAEISELFHRCLDISESQALLLSSFVVSTWLIEKLPIAPYVALIGLPRSGKTTALRLLNLLCRRSLLTSDITSASFYEVCNLTIPTILIDETATAGDRRALFHLLRVGSTKGAVAIRKNKSFSAYGAKVVCWTQRPNDAALNSRCISVLLAETDRTNLLRVTDLRVQKLADYVRRMLQQYRFENFNGLSLARVPGDESLNSRVSDLYEALALPIADDNFRRFLVQEFEEQQDFNREPLSPVQAAVLYCLDSHIHKNPTSSACAHSGLTHVVNLDLQASREPSRVSPHGVGCVLTALGLTDRKRTSAGCALLLSRDMRKKIHGLVRHYRVEIWMSKRAAVAVSSLKRALKPRSSSKEALKLPEGVSPVALSLKQAAVYTNLTVWRLRTAVWSRKLPARLAGEKFLFLRTDLDMFVSSLPQVFSGPCNRIARIS